MDRILKEKIKNFYATLDIASSPICELAKLEPGELVEWQYDGKILHGFIVEDEGQKLMMLALFTDDGFAIVPDLVGGIPPTAKYCLLAKFNLNAPVDDNFLTVVEDREVRDWLFERSKGWFMSILNALDKVDGGY